MQILGLKRMVLGGVGVGAAILLSAACGSDVTATASGAGSTSGAGGSGGAGGATSSAVVTAASSSTASSSSTGGMVDCTMGNTCEQGCCKLSEECASPIGCDTLFGFVMTSCADPAGDCVGQCLLDHSCSDILKTITTQDFGTPVAQCMFACGGMGQGGGGGMGGSCFTCGGQNCQSEIGACVQNQSDACNQFLSCAQGCGSDNACMDACATTHDSAMTQSIVSCVCKSCSNECGDACI